MSHDGTSVLTVEERRARDCVKTSCNCHYNAGQYRGDYYYYPRLDRLTSGLLMFGRNPGKAREMETQIRTRQVRKEYICRVEGEFPM